MGLRYFNILAVVLSLVIGAWSQLPPKPVVFLPTLYVTSMPERQGADTAVIYQATICNPKLYEPYMAIARINIPQGWNTAIGVYGKLEVCTTSSCDKIMCSNWKNKRFDGDHNCSFPYNATIGDLFIRATTGPAPNIDWTVALEFLTKNEYFKNHVSKPNKRYIDVPEPKARNKAPPIKVLAQIIPTGIHETVTTLNTLMFNLSFCPDSQTTQRYNVDIFVTALDSRSAFATYVCLPPIKGPCTPDKSTHYDPRGIGVNVVTLQTGSGTLKDVLVTVVGWGDGEQENVFLIGATIKAY